MLDQAECSLVGTVMAVQANYYWVRLDEGNATEKPADGEGSSEEAIQNAKRKTQNSRLLLCTRRTRLKKIGQRVMVGDRVQVEEPDWVDGRGAITQVWPRRSELDRPPVANADQILLVFAVAEPVIEPYQLSRFLIKAESTGLEVCLCLSKSDLIAEAEQQIWQERLTGWGYQPLLISSKAVIGLSELARRLSQKITIVSGPSGVGKSSLINQLIPSIDLRIGAVSGKLERGRHTTRHVELFELPTGGLLADTPGFNQPDLDCLPTELGHYFPEIAARLTDTPCQFNDCLHRDEPGCMVRGEWERYAHYREFLAAALAHQAELNQQTNPDAVLKAKTGSKGEPHYEPRLVAKKYRRESRRTQQQILQSWKHDPDSLSGEED
jgi:ribosome biogenesis GTPase / thiamine phosphate phosphatase